MLSPSGPDAIADLWRLVLSRTALLFSGFTIAQACSFFRNAIFAHTLSMGNFGIAATILVMLQLVEMLSDLSADKLIIQADDGGTTSVVGTVQTFQLMRGVVACLVIVAVAQPVAEFFRIPEATGALMAIGLAPLLRGLLNLDMRRAQRSLDNGPFLLVEVVPQIVALVATPIVLAWNATFEAVVIVALIQSATAVLVSHLAAGERMQLRFDRGVAIRIISFSWPLWLSALPLVAVYQGDRILIGRYLGMDAIAAFSAAFMLTMVPGLLVAKTANALLLPLLAEVKSKPAVLRQRLRLLLIGTGVLALVYVVAFAVFGGPLLALGFGPSYGGLGLLVALLAVIWGLRMVQVVPNLALMALARNEVLLAAGMLRALGLLPVYLVVTMGGSLVAVVIVGFLAELLASAYLAIAVSLALSDAERRRGS